MEVTFPGDPIPASYLFVDARIDWDSGSLSAFNESSPVWVLSPNNTYGDIDDIDVVSDMEAIFFGN
jgi:hypothetical protein